MSKCYFCDKERDIFYYSLEGKAHICDECYESLYFRCEYCGEDHLIYKKVSGSYKKVFHKLDHSFKRFLCRVCADALIHTYKEEGKTCNGCGKLTLFESKKGSYCSSCDHHVTKCSKCKTYHFELRTVLLEGGETEEVCHVCVKNVKYLRCSYCNTYFNRDVNKLYKRKKNLCGRCRKKYSYCDICGDIVHEEDITIKNNTSMCERCLSHRKKCHDCKRYIYATNTPNYKVVGEYAYCVQCAAKHLYAKNERWDYVPAYFHYHGKQKDSLFLGFENEARVPPSAGVHKSKVLATILSNYPPEYVYAVRDGSIGGQNQEHGEYGFEIVSHPFSLARLKEIEWKHLFHKHIKMDKTCGMHIHMSRNAFTQVHLYKLLSFVHDNEILIDHISERPPNIYSKNLREKDLLYDSQAGIKEKGTQDTYRRCKINLTNPHTVEMRSFLAVNDEHRFFKNIEFTHCMYYFTKYNRRRRQLTERYFLDYLYSRKHRYPHLYTWIENNSIPKKYPFKKDIEANKYIDPPTHQVQQELGVEMEELNLNTHTNATTTVGTTGTVVPWA